MKRTSYDARLTVVLPQEQKEALEKVAYATEDSVAKIVRRIIKEYLEKQESTH